MYYLGKRSRAELEGVRADLVAVVELALTYSPIDFSVHDGIREEAEQREYVRTGASKTLRSKHLRQKDGFGHAVDLVPYVNGKLRWELPLCIKIAHAVNRAALELDVGIVWGGGWDRLNVASPEDLVDAYVERKRLIGERPFIDGPHFQLV